MIRFCGTEFFYIIFEKVLTNLNWQRIIISQQESERSRCRKISYFEFFFERVNVHVIHNK